MSRDVVIGDDSTLTTGNSGLIKIDQAVSIGKGAWIASGNGNIIIGKECLFGPRVTIVSQNHAVQEISKETFLPWQRDSTSETTIIGERCSIGSNVTILPGTIIGNYSNIGANSVVKGKFPPGSLIAGIPGKALKIFSIPNDIENINFIGRPPYRHTSKKFF